MKAVTQLKVLGYGKWSDRMGGDPGPYEYVDLYDSDTGAIYTWSLPPEKELKRPGLDVLTPVTFELRKQAKAGVARVKKGDRAGETMDFVSESLKARVIDFPSAASTPRAAAA